MVELVIGVLGLAGIFSVCIGAFELMELTFDFVILSTRLDVQKTRLLR